jgi:uncharacterized protein (TIGR01319 family)
VTLAACADVGSTYTKVVVVDLADGALVATASHPTTVDTDVMEGLTAAIAATGRDPSDVHVCSSAGGGLRLAVVGHEALVTAEAGHRVGLSAGARVVHVAAGRLDNAALGALRAARPDVVLLVGGTDGGDAETLVHNAQRLRLKVPVVVAGNADAQQTVVDIFAGHRIPVTATENVLPRIGVLNPQPARAAIRGVFLRHVIGGKKLSRGPRFASLVRGATPDIVLTAVELLADQTGQDLTVVDVGGATTDVYSVLAPDPEREAEVAGTLWRSRTVEGDLGVRWSAPGVVEAARQERLLSSTEESSLAAAAAARAADPRWLPAGAGDRAVDLRLARLAVTIALRRHARGEPAGLAWQAAAGASEPPGAPRRGGKDLSRVRLAVGSGGVFRHAAAGQAAGVLEEALADHGGGWALPRRATTVTDARGALAAAGLLATEHPGAAHALLQRYLRAA